MKVIPLTQGKVAVVDNADFDELSKHKWCCHTDGYAVRNAYANGHRQTIYMARAIMNAPAGTQVDHADNNPLNNQRYNLRFCDHAKNQYNRRKTQGRRSSQYKGVYWYGRIGKWHSQITVNRVHIHLGYFANEAKAANAYDKAAIAYFGDFALLNFPSNHKRMTA